MAYLLESASTCCCWCWPRPGWSLAALRKGKYREGFADKLLGLVPRRDSPDALRVAPRGQPGRSQPARAAGGRAPPPPSRLGHRHLDHHADRLHAGQDALRRATRSSTARSISVGPCGGPCDAIRPDLLVLAELELWPNLIAAAAPPGPQVAIINGRLSERSFRGYRRLRPLVRRCCGKLDLVAAQNAQYAERFLGIWRARATACHVTGSLKFDGAQTDRDNPATARLRQLAGFAPDDIVFLAGSTQEPEERLALEAFRRIGRRASATAAGARAAASRALRRGRPQLLAASGLAWQRRSELDATGRRSARARVLLVDRVGELAAWWGTAAVAYVGGSMGNRERPEHDRAGGLRRRRFVRPQHAELSRHRGRAAGRRRGRRRPRRRGADRLRRRCLAEPPWPPSSGRRAGRVVAAQLGATSAHGRPAANLVEPDAMATARRSVAA